MPPAPRDRLPRAQLTHVIAVTRGDTAGQVPAVPFSFMRYPESGVPAHPKRWRVAATLSVTVLIAYYDRTSLFVALPLIAKEFAWSSQQTAEYGGLLISSFFVAYGIANIFLTPLAMRYGARKSLCVIVTLWAVFSLLGAWVSQVMLLFVASRICLGLAEGVHMPINSVLTRRWFPAGERSRANSLWVAGSYVSVLTGPLFMVPIMITFGWRNGYYLLAIGGLLISLPLVIWQIRDFPPGRPPAGPPAPVNVAGGRPYEARKSSLYDTFALLRNPDFLLMTVAGVCSGCIMQGIPAWLPVHLTRLGMDYDQLSWVIPLPYVTSFVGLAVWAMAGDWSGRRRLVAALGMAAAAILVWPAFGSASVPGFVVFIAACLLAISAFVANEFSVIQEILPIEQVGNGVGLYNGINLGVGGALGPLLVGFIVGQPGSTRGIGVACAIALLCAVCMVALHVRARGLRSSEPAAHGDAASALVPQLDSSVTEPPRPRSCEVPK